LDSHLLANIKGQDHVIGRLTSVLRRGELNLCNPNRPKGSFLFVGPTGSGKTEITQCFTEYLFGEGRLIRFDMSEFMTPASLGRFIGEKEGETGLMGKQLREIPYGTLLFDEMEKAEPRILDLFLQILDAGRITLGDNQVWSLKNYYIVFTSNIGSSEIRSMARSSFATIERVVLNQVNETLRPELVGRITEKIVFNKLSYEVQLEICKDMVQKELKRLEKLGFLLTVRQQAIDFLISMGFDKNLGARPLRAAVEKLLGDLIAQQILKGLPTNGVIGVNDLKSRLTLDTVK